MWNKPWKYKEGIAICTGLLVTGALLQATIGPVEWLIFMWPANIIALILFVAMLGMVYAMRKKVYLFRFITQVEAAVPAIATASILTVVMGLTRQVPEGKQAVDPIGLSRMLSLWPFILIYLWNIIIAAEVAVHQALHFKKRYIPSLISHMGLFIFVTCGVLGSADMKRMKIYCEEGKPEWRGIDDNQNVHELPIAIELRKFTIDEYPPKIALFDSKNGSPLPIGKPQHIVIDDSFTSGILSDWTITVEKKLDNAIPSVMLKMIKGMPEQMVDMMTIDELGMRVNADGFIEYKEKGAATALLVTARKGKVVKKGWISPGSYMFPMASFKIDDSKELAVSPREPLRYSSDVNIYTKEGKAMTANIEVNKPYTIGSYKIYQFDYNKQQGKWSTLSVFELVYDPWLPAAYSGLILLFIGAVLMLAVRRKA